jgi:hypothetical protein
MCIAREKSARCLTTADAIVNEMVGAILNDLDPSPRTEPLLLIDGFEHCSSLWSKLLRHTPPSAVLLNALPIESIRRLASLLESRLSLPHERCNRAE